MQVVFQLHQLRLKRRPIVCCLLTAPIGTIFCFQCCFLCQKRLMLCLCLTYQRVPCKPCKLCPHSIFAFGQRSLLCLCRFKVHIRKRGNAAFTFVHTNGQRVQGLVGVLAGNQQRRVIFRNRPRSERFRQRGKLWFRLQNLGILRQSAHLRKNLAALPPWQIPCELMHPCQKSKYRFLADKIRNPLFIRSLLFGQIVHRIFYGVPFISCQQTAARF